MADLSHHDHTALLGQTSLFRNVPAAALGQLADKTQEETYVPGQIIVAEGTLGDHLFLIVDGEVEVIMALGTKMEKLAATLAPCDFFGEMCIIDSGRRSASIRARIPTTLLSIDVGVMHEFFRSHPDEYHLVFHNIARSLSRRLRKLDEVYVSRAA